MSKLHSDRIEKKLESINLAILIMFIWDLLNGIDKGTQDDIVHSKSFFAFYYCIDLDTFHKWIRVYCPEIWNDYYHQKRKFTNDEANYIFEKLGRVNFKNMPPQSRKELMNEIYKDKSWKDSRRYQEMCFELKDRFPQKDIKFNKIPPKIIFEILKEEIEKFDGVVTKGQDELFKARIHVFQSVFSKYQRLSDHKEEVYRRYLRRWFSAEETKQ